MSYKPLVPERRHDDGVRQEEWTPALVPVTPVLSPHHPLPVALTPLVGRERDVVAIANLLHQRHVRLLTLIGPAGVGKTRLGLAVATDVRDLYPDGVFVIPLADLRDPDLVTSAIAQALGLPEGGSLPWEEALRRLLRDKTLLLVLDNAEQVAVAAPIVARLLSSSHGLTVVATSRAPLRMHGEHTYPVPPLVTPDLARLPPLEDLETSPAVSLFLQRAREVAPAFRLTTGNAPLVAAIVERLDGLPLAIELAAARVTLLTPAALLARLEGTGRFDVLTGGPRDQPARHRTLRDAIAWSYDLLTLVEQAAFRLLAIFTGGATLEALLDVTNDTLTEASASRASWGDVLTTVGGLVDQNLVRSRVVGDEMRFEMLESLRAYGLERLAASGEMDTTRGRHAAYYAALARKAELALTGPTQGEWFARLDREYGNLRAALEWAREADAPALGLRLATALWRFWVTRGYLSEGRAWIERFLPLTEDIGDVREDAPLHAYALAGAGVLAFTLGDYERAAGLHEQSLALYRARGEDGGVAFALNNLGLVARVQGDDERAWRLFDEGLAVRRSLGDPRAIAYSLNNLAALSRDRGDLGRAAALAGEGLALARGAGNAWSVAQALTTLGATARDRGDLGRATALAEESLGLFREVGDAAGVASSLEALAGLAKARGEVEEAAHLYGMADAWRAASGRPAPPDGHAEYDRDVATVRAALGADRFAAIWADGRALPLDQAVPQAGAAAAVPASPEAPTPRRSPDGPLSPRERDVLRLVAEGLSTKRIARMLYISEGTVRFHVASIFTKLGADTRAQAIALAARRGLL